MHCTITTGSVMATDKEIIMKTTIPKLRRTLRKVIKEVAYDSSRDQEHLQGLEDWIFQATEDEMEESYDRTIDSYLEACLDDGETIDREQVAAYLEELLENSDGVDMEGELVIHLDALEDRDEP